MGGPALLPAYTCQMQKKTSRRLLAQVVTASKNLREVVTAISRRVKYTPGGSLHFAGEP
jgi:hypothetical protein